MIILTQLDKVLNDVKKKERQKNVAIHVFDVKFPVVLLYWKTLDCFTCKCYD